MPQPYRVPVRPSVSRNTHSSGVSGSTSTSCAWPLIVRWGIGVFLDRVPRPPGSDGRVGTNYRRFRGSAAFPLWGSVVHGKVNDQLAEGRSGRDFAAARVDDSNLPELVGVLRRR